MTVAPKEKEAIPEQKFSFAISNTKEYFDLLFEVLEIGNPIVNAFIWKLLGSIPVNQTFY